VAVEAHFGGKCIEAGCVDGLRIPVKMGKKIHLIYVGPYMRPIKGKGGRQNFSAQQWRPLIFAFVEQVKVAKSIQG
jgi:hypothetical protein